MFEWLFCYMLVWLLVYVGWQVDIVVYELCLVDWFVQGCLVIVVWCIVDDVDLCLCFGVLLLFVEGKLCLVLCVLVCDVLCIMLLLVFQMVLKGDILQDWWWFFEVLQNIVEVCVFGVFVWQYFIGLCYVYVCLDVDLLWLIDIIVQVDVLVVWLQVWEVEYDWWVDGELCLGCDVVVNWWEYVGCSCEVLVKCFDGVVLEFCDVLFVFVGVSV